MSYSVIVRNPNSWNATTGIHEELANCGHQHKSISTAQACLDKLTAWHCLCGRTTKPYAPCCGTPHNSTSARWHGAEIEDQGGHRNDRHETETGARVCPNCGADVPPGVLAELILCGVCNAKFAALA